MVGGGGRGVLVRDGVDVSVGLAVGVKVKVEVEAKVGELVSVKRDVMVILGAELAGGVSEIVGVGVSEVIRLTIS